MKDPVFLAIISHGGNPQDIAQLLNNYVFTLVVQLFVIGSPVLPSKQTAPSTGYTRYTVSADFSPAQTPM